MGGRFRSRNRTRPEMKTFQGGKTKIITIIKSTKSLHVRIGHFVAQTLDTDQKKGLRDQTSQDAVFLWGDTVSLQVKY